MDVRYAPGQGVLLGAGSRWLLLDMSDVDDAFLDHLWALLTGPTPSTDAVLHAIDDRLGVASSLVLVDSTPGAESTVERGAGQLSTLDGVRSISLGHPTATPSRRLVAGVVAAAGAELRPRVSPVVPVARADTTTGPPAVDGLIDGIPPEILASRAAERAAAEVPAAAVPVATEEPVGDSSRRILDRMGSTVRRADLTPAPVGGSDPDHDGQTTYRPLGQAPADPSASDHLQQPTHETVLAVHCSSGHVTNAFNPTCRVCHEPVPPQEPQRMPRPRLGVLHLPDGERVPLDRGVLFGRQPSSASEGGEWPHLVRLPADSTYVSRTHLQVELDGWLVLATDLGSRGGTTLRVPGRPPQRIRAHDRYVWEPGQVLDLADSFEIVYGIEA